MGILFSLLGTVPFFVIVLALLIGCALITLECFLPGIGAAGALGALSLAFAIIALIPYIGWNVIYVIFAVILFVLLMILIFARNAGKKKNPLVLQQKTDKESGFSANDDNTCLIGKNGVTLSELRPSGVALIDGRRVDVVSEGEFIEKDREITVVKTEGCRVIVKEYKEK